MTYGLLLAGGGLIFLGTQLQVTTSFLILLPVYMIMGHGMASVMAPMTAAVMNSVGPQRAGLGSAMSNTSREVGGVFGIALLGTILTTKLKASLAPALLGLGLTGAQQNAIAIAGGHGTLDPALLARLGLSASQKVAVTNAFATSFMDGFHVALLVGGLVLVGAAVVANRFIPGRDTVHVTAPGDDHVPVAVEAAYSQVGAACLLSIKRRPYLPARVSTRARAFISRMKPLHTKTVRFPSRIVTSPAAAMVCKPSG